MDQKTERKDMTLPECGENFLKYMKINSSEKTITAYRSDLVQFFGWLKEYKEVETITYEFLNSVIPEDLHEWMGDINASASTKARKVSTLHSFFNYLNDLGHIENTAHHKLRKPKLPKDNRAKYLTKEQASKLKNYVLENGSERDFAIIMVMLNAGLRISELINLNIDSIEDNILTVIKSKGNKSRQIGINKETVEAIDRYIKVRPKSNDRALFLLDYFTGEAYRITKTSVENMIEKYRVACRIKHCTPHTLRHTYGTMKRAAGVSLDTLKELMGHENITSTLIYAQPTLDEKVRVAEMGCI